jgi:CheY-like chemotaxis protein
MMQVEQAVVAPPPVRILIVEDHPDGRESLRLLLEILGHHVEVASDGIEGLHKALIERPQAVLLDIGLPGLDGFEVARRLRATLGDGIRLLACTAYGQPADRARAEAAGFDGLLVKPIDLRKLDEWLAWVGQQ